MPKFSYDEFSRVGPQLGTNPGGVHEHQGTGEKWYVKFPQMHREFHPSDQAMLDHQENHARSEVLAGKLYERAGISMPEMHLVRHSGGALGGKADQIGVASKIIPNLRESGHTLHEAKGAAHGFATDAWLGNYDAVGYDHDNMLLNRAGHAVRIDPGASLRYKAQGAPKPAQGAKSWGPKVDELRMLHGPQHDHAWEEQNMAHVVSRANQTAVREGAKRVTNIPDHEIRSIVANHGPRDSASNTKLADTLISRKQHIGDHFGTSIIKSLGAGMNSDWGSKKPLQPRTPDRRLLVHPYREARATVSSSPLANNNYTTPTRSGNTLRKAVGTAIREASERTHEAADEAAWSAPGKRVASTPTSAEVKVRTAAMPSTATAHRVSRRGPTTSTTPIQKLPKSQSADDELNHLAGLEKALSAVREASERVQHAATTADPATAGREAQRRVRGAQIEARAAATNPRRQEKTPPGPGSPALVTVPAKAKSLPAEDEEGLEHLIGLEKALGLGAIGRAAASAAGRQAVQSAVKLGAGAASAAKDAGVELARRAAPIVSSAASQAKKVATKLADVGRTASPEPPSGGEPQHTAQPEHKQLTIPFGGEHKQLTIPFGGPEHTEVAHPEHTEVEKPAPTDSPSHAMTTVPHPEGDSASPDSVRERIAEMQQDPSLSEQRHTVDPRKRRTDWAAIGAALASPNPWAAVEGGIVPAAGRIVDATETKLRQAKRKLDRKRAS